MPFYHSAICGDSRVVKRDQVMPSICSLRGHMALPEYSRPQPNGTFGQGGAARPGSASRGTGAGACWSWPSATSLRARCAQTDGLLEWSARPDIMHGGPESPDITPSKPGMDGQGAPSAMPGGQGAMAVGMQRVLGARWRTRSELELSPSQTGGQL